MSNTRHLPRGTTPPRVNDSSSPPRDADGPPPPSPDVAKHDLAQVIGQSVAYHVAELLAPVLQRLVDQQERYACLVCAAKGKRAERAHEIAVANAKAAAEPEPERPDVRVTQSFTDGARGPVCWGCYDPDKDGPYDLAEYLPASADLGGQPVSAA